MTSGSEPQEIARTTDPAAAHVPALDGVRGLAIVLVLFFHFLLIDGDSPVVRIIQKTWGYGWAGVDLFFVLSGFLITGILWDAKGGPHYFRNFYARRTVRIFPLYYAFLILFMLVLPRLVPWWTELYGEPGAPVWSYFLYVYNFAQHVPHGENFSHALGVVWSLCIEEQFYLVWPVVVLVCSRRVLLGLCVALITASIAARGFLAARYPWELSYVPISQWTITRMDPLAVGAAIALLLRGGSACDYTRASRVILVAIPVVLVGMNFTGGSLIRNPVFLTFGYTLLAVMFGAMLLWVVTAPANAPIVRVFSNPVLRLLGRLSYAIYLFNQPVKYAMQRFMFDPNDRVIFGSAVVSQIAFLVIGATISTAMAFASWRLLEMHFLKLKVFFPMTRHDPTGAASGKGESSADVLPGVSPDRTARV